MSFFLSFHLRWPPIVWAAEKDYSIIQDAGVEDLIWGILHLLSRFPAEQGAPPSLLCRLPTEYRKHFLFLECQECLIILLRHKKGFWCPRIKACIIGGIWGHICKLCRCCKGFWTETLMELLLSRGWYGGEIFFQSWPGPDLILPILIRSKFVPPASPAWSFHFWSCFTPEELLLVQYYRAPNLRWWVASL